MDIMFDAPDQKSDLLNNYGQDLGFTPPAHGDKIFANMIRDVQKMGTDIVLASKIAHEPTRVPPLYILFPNPIIMEANPVTVYFYH